MKGSDATKYLKVRRAQSLESRAAGEAPCDDGHASSRYAVYWETFGSPRVQWQVFATKEEALAYGRALGRQGTWVHGVSKA
jgi:hypothetical protein